MPILNSAYFTECRRHIVIPCGKVCRIKNRHTFKVCRIKNRHTFKSMPILNSSYHAVKYAELRIGILLKVCRFVIRHITQTQTQTETELLRRHRNSISCRNPFWRSRPPSHLTGKERWDGGWWTCDWRSLSIHYGRSGYW